MQTHQDIWFSVSDQQEHVFFRACNQPTPILDFIPWPIRVPSVVFPDGTMMSTAGGGNGVPSFLAGPGISVTTGVGTVTISVNASTIPSAGGPRQIPYTASGVLAYSPNFTWNNASQAFDAGCFDFQGDPSNGAMNIHAPSPAINSDGALYLNANGSLYFSGTNIQTQGPIGISDYTFQWAFSVAGDININAGTGAFAYRISSVPFANLDVSTGAGVDLTNISLINAGAPGQGGTVLSLNPYGGDVEVYDDININDPTDAGFSYRINNIPLATYDTATNGIDLVNISTINGAPYGVSAPVWAKVPVSSSDILGLNTTPKIIVNAAGPNTVIIVLGFVFEMQPGSTPYTGGNAITVSYGDGTPVTQSTISSSVINSATPVMYQLTSATAGTRCPVNTPVRLINTTAYTGGNGTGFAWIYYSVLNL